MILTQGQNPVRLFRQCVIVVFGLWLSISGCAGKPQKVSESPALEVKKTEGDPGQARDMNRSVDRIEAESRHNVPRNRGTQGYDIRKPLLEEEVLGDKGVSQEPQDRDGSVTQDEPRWGQLKTWASGKGQSIKKLFASSKGGKSDSKSLGVDQAFSGTDPNSEGEAPWQSGVSANVGRGHYVQLEDLNTSSAADKMVKRLKSLNVPFLLRQARVKGELVHQVYVGPFANKGEAEKMARDLEKQKIKADLLTPRVD
ncbi:MAG: Sporulation related domain [Magnetococcales bacterium]|nr:Sporulation related domain [Magnetococcales bacterium]HIJ82753.1 SPOR domain-containing protein [Magnetococcales bacterium]